MRRSAALAGCAIWLAAARVAAAPQLSVVVPDAAAPALASGSSMLAVADGALATAWNPAGLAWLRGGDLLVSHRELESGWTRQDGAFALRCHDRHGIVLGLQGAMLRRPGKPAREATGTGTPPAAAYRITLQSALQLRHDVSFGVALGAFSDLPVVTGGPADEGMVADAGVQWRRDGSFAGAAVRGVRLGSDVSEAPVVSAGLGQAIQANRVVWMLQVDRIDNAYRSGLGLMCRPATGRSVLRGGVERPPHGAWIGCGGIGFEGDRLRVDYACRSSKDMHPEHVLTVGIGLGALPIGPDPAWRVADPQPRRAENNAPQPTAAPSASKPPVAAATPKPAAKVPSAAATKPVAPPRGAIAPPAPAAAATTPLAPPPRPPGAARAAAPVEDTAPHGVRVVAGPFPDLEAAANAIFKLRSLDLQPGVETRGEKFFIVVQRCATRIAGETLRSRVASCGIASQLEDE